MRLLLFSIGLTFISAVTSLVSLFVEVVSVLTVILSKDMLSKFNSNGYSSSLTMLGV